MATMYLALAQDAERLLLMANGPPAKGEPRAVRRCPSARHPDAYTNHGRFRCFCGRRGTDIRSA